MHMDAPQRAHQISIFLYFNKLNRIRHLVCRITRDRMPPCAANTSRPPQFLRPLRVSTRSRDSALTNHEAFQQPQFSRDADHALNAWEKMTILDA